MTGCLVSYIDLIFARADGTAGGASRAKSSGKTTNGTSDNKKVAELERRLADVSLDGRA